MKSVFILAKTLGMLIPYARNQQHHCVNQFLMISAEVQ